MEPSELRREAGTAANQRRQSGVPTNDLVFSAHVGTNDELFPQILSLYVPLGSTVADVTFGKGVFWRRVPESAYKVLATDLKQGVDCRQLPYRDESLDCVVFDPPYMHTPGGSAHVGHQSFERYYANNSSTSALRYHEAVLDLYFTAAREAHRVLRGGGVYIVKCQDEVCANKQRLTHIEIINELADVGFIAEDLFVLVRPHAPGVSRLLRQAHARKNHSYFIVFLKMGCKKRWVGLDPDNRLALPRGNGRGRKINAERSLFASESAVESGQE
ncbi:MAG: site-specific DNA-methyltransferase [Armatimonadota bacterium]